MSAVLNSDPIDSDQGSKEWPTAIKWLVEEGIVSEEVAVRTLSASAVVSASPIEYLRGTCSNADLYEACSKSGDTITTRQLSDLPEWTLVINDAHQLLGGGARSKSVAIIVNDKDRRERQRCFVVHTPDATNKEIVSAVTSVVSSKRDMAGKVEVSKEIIDVLYGEWDGRGQKSVSGRDEESSFHREFDEICEAAIALKASDIHIGSTGNSGSIKFRVDGEIEHYKPITAGHAKSLCMSVYNTLSEASSVNESFNPTKTLDSSIERNLSQGRYRFRFSNLPMAPAGFDVTLRIIPIGVTSKRRSPRELGYSEDQEEELKRIFANSSGLILVGGTTGSGKSTTVANMLQQVAEERKGKKIRTVEEPVEFLIPGTCQHPVTRQHGDKRDFMIMLRQLLRADPDIISIGEIRDGDTAELAIQAVRSGHLCVSTIHADGCPIFYDRLVGMGVPRLDMASVGLVAGFIYQKLVPILCLECRIPFSSMVGQGGESYAEVISRVETITGGDTSGIYFRSLGGCNACRKKGASGRTVCAEIMRPTGAMLDAIAKADSRTIWREWRKTIDKTLPGSTKGRTAFEHAVIKMGRGIVCPVDVEKEFHFLDEGMHEDFAQ